MKFNEIQICPKCGKSMLMMYGCGWDYEYEFKTTSYPNA